MGLQGKTFNRVLADFNVILGKEFERQSKIYVPRIIFKLNGLL